MMERKVGRPKAKQLKISPERIIAKAIDILDEKGIEQLSMRLIAKELAITPMAIYHYFEDKDMLINAIANTLYQDITVANIKSPHQKIEHLLLQYREKVIRYPQITLAIFSAPVLFPEQATRITEGLIQLLQELGLADHQSTQWAHIFIDYTHGEALATAARLLNTHRTDEKIHHAKENYTEALKMFLRNVMNLDAILLR